MIQKREARIWAVAQGKAVPATIDDSDTGELVRVETNVKARFISPRPRRPRRASSSRRL